MSDRPDRQLSLFRAPRKPPHDYYFLTGEMEGSSRVSRGLAREIQDPAA